MNKKVTSYLALSVVTLGALAAVALSGNNKDNNFKDNDEVIYLNKQNLIGEAVENSALKFESSKMFAFYDEFKTNDSKSLRFATAIRGEIDSISYKMSKIGDYEEKLESITKVYRGLEVGGNTFYYDGATLTTNESAQRKYYWAVFNITYADTVSVKEDDVVSMELTINGETTIFSSSLTQSKLGGGDGSETNPYLIYSQAGWDKYVEDANANAKNFSKKYISLVASNLNATRKVINFYGYFDGHENSIELKINEKENENNSAALFGINRGGTIKNLKTTGTVNGIVNCAGIVGINDGTVENCANYASIVYNGSRAGGIAAYSRKGSKIINCKNYGIIDGSSAEADGSNLAAIKGVGGIVGTVQHDNSNTDANITIQDCENYGKVTNKLQCAGGIIGAILSNGNKVALKGSIKVTNCNNYNAITSEKTFVGGIIGMLDNNNITIRNCNNKKDATISGTSFVGGIVGALGYTNNIADRSGTQVVDCSNDATVIASIQHTSKGYRVGGIAGMAWGTNINNCKNNGIVKGGETEATINFGNNNSSDEIEKLCVGYLVGYKTSTAKIDGE